MAGRRKGDISRRWTQEEEDYLVKNRIYQSLSVMAKQINRSRKAVEQKIHRLRNAEPKEFIKTETVETRTIPVRTKHIDIILELKERILNLPRTEINVSTKKSIEGDTLIVHFTDWHIGRIVKDEDGNEIYNIEIFKSRVNKLFSEIFDLLDLYITKGTQIQDVVILCTGDILDGMGIFSSQEHYSETSPPFQVMLGVEIIQNFIFALLDRNLTVSFYGVKGNHGEIREGGKVKDPNANWDLMLYLILKYWSGLISQDNRVRSGLIPQDNKVSVYYSELDYLNLSIQGWRYHIRHIAPQQSDTPAGKAKFLGWARKHECNVLVYGHYHHYGIGDRSGVTVIRGGSLTGSDEYSELLAEESEPIQLLWGCCKDRPVTFMYAIDLGQRKQK